MGLKDRLRRFTSVRDIGSRRSRGATPDDNDDADAQVPINSPYEELGEEPEDYLAQRRGSDSVDIPPNKLPSAAERSSSEPRKLTGKRKPSNASRLRQSHHLPRSHSAEPRPQDYLYFGEGGKAPGSPSASTHQVQARSSSTTAGLAVPPQRTTAQNSSGFLNSGTSSPQMASTYSSLTYGGSLQYDYSGTQAPGVGGL